MTAQAAVPDDTLFIATGSSAKDDMPWNLVGTANNTFDRIHALQGQVARVDTIIVAGGGLTGAETAGKIGYQYGRKGKRRFTLFTTMSCRSRRPSWRA